MLKKIIYSWAFFISGMAGLLYEILWIRQLSLAFGSVAIIIAGVSALFLTGLAVGAFLIGKINLEAKRAKQLPIIYFALEIATIILGYFNFKTFFYISYFPVSERYLLALVCLLIQALAMGATWPVMLEIFKNASLRRNAAGLISFLNTLGAATGAFLASYFLILNLGIVGSFKVAVSLNLIAGCMVLLTTFKKEPKISERAIAKNYYQQTAPGNSKIILFYLFSAGFIGMAMEILWTRGLALVLGSSVYAYALILTVILLGLATGGLISTNPFFRRIDVDRLNLILFWETIFLLLGAVFLTKLPFYITSLNQSVVENLFLKEQITRFFLASLVLFIPSVLSGLFLPLGIKLLDEEGISNSGSVAYFVNTLASALGGFTASLFILPLIGLEWGIILISLLGVFIVSTYFASKNLRISVGLSLVALVLVFIIYLSWDKQNLSVGAVFYGQSVLRKNSGIKTLFYKDGREATVTVNKRENTTMLRINGKVDASNEDDMGTQVVLGHVPILLHSDPQRVLVIGMGSGVTAGAISQHPRVKELTVVEIEPVVIEAAAKYFADENYNVVENPKAKIVINDARNFLLTTDQKFEVITSEPSNPWIAGEANLFTQEYFEIGKRHLSANGIFFQWLHLYNLRPDEVKSIVATFTSVFPYTQIWTSTRPQDIFLAGKASSPFKLSWDRFKESLEHESVVASLNRQGFADEIMLFGLLWARSEFTDRLAEGGQINTDQHPILQYRAPYGLYEETLGENLKMLLNVYDNSERVFEIEGMPLAEKEKLRKVRESRNYLVQATALKGIGDLKEAAEIAEKGLQLEIATPSLKRVLADIYCSWGKTYGDVTALEKSINLDNNEVSCFKYLIANYLAAGRLDEANKLIENGMSKFPWSGEILMYKAIILEEQRDSYKAKELFTEALKLEPWNELIHNNFANLYYREGAVNQALDHWEMSLKLDSNQPQIRETYRKVILSK